MAADTYISNAVQYYHGNDTDTLYALVRNVAKQVRKVSDGTWESWPPAAIANNIISEAVAEGLLWSGDMPIEVGDDFFLYEVRKRVGGSAANTDPVVGNAKGFFNGDIISEADGEKLEWLYKRFHNKTIMSRVTDTFKVFKDDDATEETSQDITEAASVETLDRAI